MKSVVITGSGQITLPAELRRKHGWKTGDRVLVGENAEGQVVVKPSRTVEELAGIFKLKQGVKADPDFANIIHEAMDEAAERLVAETNAEYDAG